MGRFSNHGLRSHPIQSRLAFASSEDRNEEDRRLTLIESSAVEGIPHPETGEPTAPMDATFTKTGYEWFGIPATYGYGRWKNGHFVGVCVSIWYTGVCTLSFLDFDVWTKSCGFWPQDNRSVKHSLHYTNFTHSHISETSQTNMCFWLFFGDEFFYPKNPDPAYRNTNDPPFMTIKKEPQVATWHIQRISHTIHVWYIYLHLPYFYH